MRHVIWLKNRTSTVAIVSKTPHEVVTGKKPNLSMLPEWGCPVWVHTKKNLKLEGRAVEGHWIGYDEQSKGSQIYWPDKRSVTVERSLTFAKPFIAVLRGRTRTTRSSLHLRQANLLPISQKVQILPKSQHLLVCLLLDYHLFRMHLAFSEFVNHLDTYEIFKKARAVPLD